MLLILFLECPVMPKAVVTFGAQVYLFHDLVSAVKYP